MFLEDVFPVRVQGRFRVKHFAAIEAGPDLGGLGVMTGRALYPGMRAESATAQAGFVVCLCGQAMGFEVGILEAAREFGIV